jgi:hypothetical protein
VGHVKGQELTVLEGQPAWGRRVMMVNGDLMRGRQSGAGGSCLGAGTYCIRGAASLGQEGHVEGQGLEEPAVGHTGLHLQQQIFPTVLYVQYMSSYSLDLIVISL